MTSIDGLFAILEDRGLMPGSHCSRSRPFSGFST